ncbi:MAG: CARDB domain-containing protein, partial [Anaerolineae bacterium]
AFDDTTVVVTPEYQLFLPLITRNFVFQGPDLVVTNVEIEPTSPSVGQQVTVRVTVQNQGEWPVAYGNNFYVDLYVDRQPEPLLVGEISWGVQGGWFRAGESRTLEDTYTFSTGGVHTLYVQVDTDNTVLETDETNNVMSRQVTVVTIAGQGEQPTPQHPTELPDYGPRPTPTPLP